MCIFSLILIATLKGRCSCPVQQMRKLMLSKDYYFPPNQAGRKNFLVSSVCFYSFMTLPKHKSEMLPGKSCCLNFLHNSYTVLLLIYIVSFCEVDDFTSIITNGSRSVCTLTFFHLFNRYLLSS